MIIGLYRARDPFDVMPIERIHALAAEALFQGVTLIIFDSKGVNFENKTVTGKIIENGSWVEKILPFPQALITDNPTPLKNRTKVEERIRQEIPITTYLLHGKDYMAKNILAKTELSKYLIPTFELKVASDVIEYLNEKNSIFIKPIGGYRGIGIYNIIRKSSEEYILKNNVEMKEFNKDQLIEFITGILEKKYIMQPTIKAKTKDELVYDFRIHIQRRGNGEWGITKIYPRIGLKGNILSNVSQGGMISSIQYFLFTQFGEEKAKFYEEELKKVALEIAIAIDKHYKFKIDELGIDLTIDEKGDIKFFEANAGPQSKYHEWERAKNSIAYAKYIANKSKNIDQPMKKEKYTVAMLAINNQPNILKYYLASEAHLKGMNFYYFTSNNIDYENKKIKGYCYENEKWVQKNFDYPDYIYDRLLQRGGKKHGRSYKEFESIPFSNMKSPSGSLDKLNTYELMEKSEITRSLLIPYKFVKTPKDLITFIERNPKVIFKFTEGTMGFNVSLIEKIEDYYIVQERLKKEKYSYLAFIDFINERLKSPNSRYVVQDYIQSNTKTGSPFDIRTHMMKNHQGKWDIVKIYPRIGVQGSTVSNMHFGGTTCEINLFLTKHLEMNNSKEFYNQLVNRAKEFATAFEEQFKFHFSEMALDIGIDKNNNMYVFEVNMNRIGNLSIEHDVAKSVISYAKYYLESHS